MSLELFLQVLGFGSGAVPPAPGVYEAIGGTIHSQVDDGSTANAQLLYDSDGGCRKRTETEIFTPFYTDLDPWSSLHPAELDGADWCVWLEHTSGDNQFSGGNALDTWWPLSSDVVWEFLYLNGGPATSNGVFLVKISDDGGSTDHDTAVMTMDLEILQP